MGSYFFTDHPSYDETPTKLATFKASHGGRWSGRQWTYRDTLGGAGSILANSINTGVTSWNKDRWVYGFIHLIGPDKVYPVIGSSVTGELTIPATYNAAADWALYAAGGGANLQYALTLLPEMLDSGEMVGLTMEVKPGEKDSDNLFGVYVYYNGDLLYKFPNLSFDTASPYYIDTVINQAEGVDDIEVDIDWTGGHSVLYMGANHVHEAVAYGATGANKVGVIPAKILNYTGTGNGTVAAWDFTGLTDCTPTDIRILITGGGATFNVEDPAHHGTLPSGTVGVAYPVNGWKSLPGFTVTAGTIPFTDGDEFNVRIDPLPWWYGLEWSPTMSPSTYNQRLSRKCYLYEMDPSVPAMTAAKRHLISKFTATTIEVEGTLKNSIQMPTAAVITGAEVTLPLTFGAGVDNMFKVATPTTPAGVTGTAIGVALATGAAVVLALNTAWGLAGGAGAPFTWTDTDLALGKGTVTYTDTEGLLTAKGMDSWGQVLAQATDCYTVIGFTVGASKTYGIPGARLVVSSYDVMEGGEDGFADIVDTDYTNRLSPLSTPLLQALGQDYGLIKCAAPGVSTTAVQKAGTYMAEELNLQWRRDLPDSINDGEDESAVQDHIDNTLGRSDFAVVTFPTSAMIADPFGSSGLYRTSLTGMIHGDEAKVAVNNGGYHKAEAGVETNLPKIVKMPWASKDWEPDQEILNPRGIGMLMKKSGRWILWGDRTNYLNTEWVWKHQREQMSHYEHVLMANFDWIIYALPSKTLWAKAAAVLRAYFTPEWDKGALDPDVPFDTACVIAVDDSLNTDATEATGDLYAAVELKLVGVVERFVIMMSKAGIFEKSA